MSKLGFTLVEMLLCVSIIAILLGIAVVVINPEQSKKKARDARRINDVKAIQSALEVYMTDFKKYPCVNPAPNKWDRIPGDCMKTSLVSGKYISELPSDPTLPKGSYPPSDPCALGTTGFGYNYISNGDRYIVTAMMETPSSIQGSSCHYLPAWNTVTVGASCRTPDANRCYGVGSP